MEQADPIASRPRLFIITGAMAVGKSTVAQALAERLEKSVHLRGDVFRKMIASGAAEMGPILSVEARNQLDLRHALACDAARRYHAAGFDVVYQDIIIGPDLAKVAEALADLDPLVIILKAHPQTLLARDHGRHKNGYHNGFPPEVLAEAIEHDTPPIGISIDTTNLDVGAVISRILSS